MTHSTSLANYTTLSVGGQAQKLTQATTREQVIECVSHSDDQGIPVLILGGGSNVVCADEGFPGHVIAMRTRATAWSENRAVVDAGVDWDTFVVDTLTRGFGAMAPLSGIPGSVGAAPIQNIGAYGCEVAEFIYSVSVWDRKNREVRELSRAECGFGYRNSRFKMEPDRWVILGVTCEFESMQEIEIEYAQLAQVLQVAEGTRVAASVVRDAVLALRRNKSMVLDESDADSRSTGSFFLNPIISRDHVPQGAPAYSLKHNDPRASTHAKTSAAWLIEQAGFPKGFSVNDSGVRVSTHHTLAIANAAGGSAADVLHLAGLIRQGVWDRFAIELEPEPILVNCQLPAVQRTKD